MKKETINRILSSIILVPLAFFFIIKGSFLFIFFIGTFFLVTAYEWHLMSDKKNFYYPGLLFLLLSFYTVYIFRSDYPYENFQFFLTSIIICISTDIGGYTFGKIFKGPKITKISPNKTYSGMFGGYFLSIISVIVFINYGNSIKNLIKLDFIWNPFFTFKIFVLVILISSISQIGDLIVSYFKRLSKIKNTGKIIPGHGGLLDRIDGMIFAIPASYFLSKFLI